ncbi:MULTISPECIES: EthD family reductase [Paraburkholderia]|uniref:EthD family reductase n=1 Tax=Paraburkholderia pallida TaxID=2547399 RepID=A0A4P7CSZ9_9BURK|nr:MULTISPECIES: EthD family reductase [Paraburkholderia]QBQ99065.1 EthD family reductase [Paraburkholderia pallida]
MIKVSVLYPAGDGTHRFDIDYYINRHLPMVMQKFGAACKGLSAEQGIAGGMPGTPPAYAAMCHFTFDSVDDFQAAMMPHAKDIMSDVPNYTDITPILQVSEVKI